MLSRVAESIYWMGRYMERAENIARFVDVNLHLMLDLPGRGSAQWEPLITVTADNEAFEERYGAYTQENVIRFLTYDPEYPGSILSCLAMARENARSIREIISSEMWQQINSLYLMVKRTAVKDVDHANPHAFFQHVKLSKHLFTGLMHEGMSHGEAWHFAHLGMLLERADKTSRILDVKYFILLPNVEYVGTPYDNIEWAAVLKSTSGLEMYRKRFHRITPTQVADFMIFDTTFPRAVRFCVQNAEQSLYAITGTKHGSFSNDAERKLGRLRAELGYGDIDEVINRGIHQFIDELQRRFNDIGGAVHETFFAVRPIEHMANGAERATA
ncbi:MAG: alpha-E domain-containing protein [Deltaproteobacteria bacterium]|nr:alpha-E domain-containing protein [Deltaproteobacteria bacterium]MCB9488081.1 alpha-E domain-containing protein [Deltaproteobacteria bacterium]